MSTRKRSRSRFGKALAACLKQQYATIAVVVIFCWSAPSDDDALIRKPIGVAQPC